MHAAELGLQVLPQTQPYRARAGPEIKRPGKIRRLLWKGSGRFHPAVQHGCRQAKVLKDKPDPGRFGHVTVVGLHRQGIRSEAETRARLPPVADIVKAGPALLRIGDPCADRNIPDRLQTLLPVETWISRKGARLTRSSSSIRILLFLCIVAFSRISAVCADRETFLKPALLRHRHSSVVSMGSAVVALIRSIENFDVTFLHGRRRVKPR